MAIACACYDLAFHHPVAMRAQKEIAGDWTFGKRELMYGLLYGYMWAFYMVHEFGTREKWAWIYKSGLHGLCPRCGTGKMFKRWLKVERECPDCGLDYDFATPDDGPAFFSLCFIAFPLVFLVVWFEVAFSPPWWMHALVSVPLMIIPCVLALHPIKGWLVASQYVNKAQEAGTGALWDKLNARAKEE